MGLHARPIAIAIGVLQAGLLDVGALVVVEHVVMLLAMLGVMLLRPAEYIRHAGAPVDLQPGAA